MRLAVAMVGAAALFASAAGMAAVTGGSHAADNKFDVWEFLVLGNHVLPQTVIEGTVYPFLGPDRDIDTVKRAAAALEQAYKQAGYGAVFVDIPPQEVSNGIVRLKVTEGTLENVRIRGARYFSDRQIRAGLPSLATGQTPLLTALQQQLSALNSQTPDRQITPVLKAGSQPGTVDVDLDVKDKLPLHASISYDDRHTAQTTPNRLTANLAYDNLWQRLDSLSLLYQTAPANRKNASVASGTYVAHVPGASGFAAISYTHTNSNVLALGTLGVLGKGDIYGLHWVQPLPGTDVLSQNLNAGADYKSVNTDVRPDVPPTTDGGTSAESSAPVTAPVHYMNWSNVYTATWRFPTRTITTSLGANFGLDDIVNKAQEFNTARYDASADYLYLRFSSGVIQRLPANFAVLTRVSGQWADTPLVNNEQFSLGGVDTVRGYLEAETLGDSGAAATVELHSPDFGPHLRPVLTQLYLFTFVDAGIATLLDPLPGQDYHLDLWSTGAGLQLAGPGGLVGSVDYAIPEKNGIDTHRHHGRVDFSLQFGF
jgi:hemolysin activation/secretion protein